MTALRAVGPRNAWLAGSSGSLGLRLHDPRPQSDVPSGRTRTTSVPSNAGATSSDDRRKKDRGSRRPTTGQAEQEQEQRLLGVHAVLGLIPDRRRVRAVDHLVGDLVSPVRRQAVQHDHGRTRPAPTRPWFTWKAAEDEGALVRFGLLAHARPDVGVQDVAPARPPSGRCSPRPNHRSRARSRAPGARRAGSARSPVGVATRTVIPVFAPASEQRVRDVVAVADVREHGPVERPDALADREEVRERLARMLEVRERVHDRHGRRPARAPRAAPARTSEGRSRRRSGTTPAPCPRSSRRAPAAARWKPGRPGARRAVRCRPRRRRACASTASRRSARSTGRRGRRRTARDRPSASPRDPGHAGARRSAGHRRRGSRVPRAAAV